MELLGYPGVTDAETQLVRQKLRQLTVLPLSEAIEEKTIRLRQTRNIKLPDAIIAATAMEYHLELLTFDQKLEAVMASIAKR